MCDGIKEVKIYVHCVKGENVPIRADYIKDYIQAKSGALKPNNSINFDRNRATPNNPPGFIPGEGQENVVDMTTNKDMAYMINTPMVETYVEVALIYNDSQTAIKRTNVDEGSTPKWNEVLDFDWISKDRIRGFTKEELITSESMIRISLFDRRQEWTLIDDKKVIQEENRFLGSIEVPLLTVLFNPEKLDSNFRLQRPMALSAYRVLDEEIYFCKEDQLADEQLRKNE